jgi:hypothetical protein
VWIPGLPLVSSGTRWHPRRARPAHPLPRWRSPRACARRARCTALLPAPGNRLRRYPRRARCRPGNGGEPSCGSQARRLRPQVRFRPRLPHEYHSRCLMRRCWFSPWMRPGRSLRRHPVPGRIRRLTCNLTAEASGRWVWAGRGGRAVSRSRAVCKRAAKPNQTPFLRRLLVGVVCSLCGF